jgi:hypothetical protein
MCHHIDHLPSLPSVTNCRATGLGHALIVFGMSTMMALGLDRYGIGLFLLSPDLTVHLSPIEQHHHC